VLFDPSLDAGARLRVELDIVAALTDALGPVGERTDVVDLGRAGSGVAFRAIRDGRVRARSGRAGAARRPHRAALRRGRAAPGAHPTGGHPSRASAGSRSPW